MVVLDEVEWPSRGHVELCSLNIGPCFDVNGKSYLLCQIIYWDTEYSCYFVPKARALACPASGSPWLLFCQVFGTSKQYLLVQLCLPLSTCSSIVQLTLSCLFFLAPWYEAWTVASHLHYIYENTLRPYNYLDRGLQLYVREIKCLETRRNENMSWDIERAKIWVEQRARPTF